MMTKCSHCSGTGTVLDFCGSCSTRCTACKGSGRVKADAVHLDLKALEVAAQGPSYFVGRSELTELLRRARQLAAAEAVLREHGKAIVGACKWPSNPEARAAVEPLSALLSDLGITEEEP